MPEMTSATARAIRFALARRDGRVVALAVTVGYLVAYLVGTRSLVSGTGEFGIRVAAQPLSLVFRRNGIASFEPIALLELGALRLLVSPPELLIGMSIAALVGLNGTLTYLAWRQPAACGISPGVGAVAAVPALLSGSACCAPVVLLVLGIQASGILLVAVDVLLPAAVLLLVGSLVLVSRRIEPAGFGHAPD